MISSMVAPCGKGTFSSSYSDNYVPCTKCSSLKGAGITTESAGAASVESCTCEWAGPCCRVLALVLLYSFNRRQSDLQERQRAAHVREVALLRATGCPCLMA